MKRRSRRQRAMDAAEQRRRASLAEEGLALRLSLEAAMGMAAEVAEEAPAEAAQAVQAAVRAARVAIPAAPDVAALADARKAVATLLEAVEEARRLKALAEDDEDVLMLLRAL
jgi:predicted Zn-dependent protease